MCYIPEFLWTLVFRAQNIAEQSEATKQTKNHLKLSELHLFVEILFPAIYGSPLSRSN